MATVASTGIFPSIRFIATDALGDLQEVVGSYATNASLTNDGLTLTAVAEGVVGNDLSFAVVEDDTASGLAFSVVGNNITLTAESAPLVPEVPATADSLTSDGVTYTAQVGGANSGITITITENNATEQIVVSGNAVTIELDDLIGNKNQGDIATAYANAGSTITDLIDISIADGTSALSTILSSEALSGGTDLVAEVPAVTIASYTQGEAQTAFSNAPASVTDLVTLSIANSATNLVAVLSETNFTGGSASVGGSLDADAKYVMIKQTELHDLSDTETGDGRKLLWGVLHKASQTFEALNEPPANFTITRGNPISIEGGTAIRQTYTVQATYAVQGLDLRAEA